MKTEIEVVVMVEFEAEVAGRDLLSVSKVERRSIDAGRIAAEADARATFLRSRPMSEAPGLRRFERRVLVELDALSARARVLAIAETRGTVSEPEEAAERGQLDRLAFVAFRRFGELVASLDEPLPTRARPADPRQRKEELDAIESFLAARGMAGTGTEGKSR